MLSVFSKRQEVSVLLKIWFLFFVYSMIVALLVQLVVLPYLFPAWHSGNGLLVGGDWLTFHRIAADLAQRILIHGWSEWELRPDGQAPAGIAAIVYALTIPEPWTLVPIHAALHATAGVVLLRIVKVFVSVDRYALWCVLPFVMYPSAATWYTQIHKDGYSILGCFLFVYGWIRLAQMKDRWNFWFVLRVVLWIMTGSFLVWVVRPYGTQMLQGTAVLLSIFLTFIFFLRAIQTDWPWERAVSGILLMWSLVIGISPLAQTGIVKQVPVAEDKKVPVAEDKKVPVAEDMQKKTVPDNHWQATGWMPSALESKVYSLAVTREDFLRGYPSAASNIDMEISFHSVKDMILYLPRAIQIGFLAPFPSQWFEGGSLESNTMMRRLSMFEMIGIYISLMAFPIAIARWGRRTEFWIVLIFSCVMILIYSYTIPNVGTLYRMRYGFLMLIAAVGFAGLLSFIKNEYQYLNRE
ncbi:hypothetical protein [Effusibacillus lacus]|uniref:hypothetical protein n=1 Tax=Effusibacillus lacus TaxID=1348429 RepID=UPI000BB8307E|nr:hypothetical protein [Effusibacillus lacus]TCS73730.1 hypothetical protein EDD64_11630 [Effusibacillus lacus]